MKKTKTQKGITLVALIITIIVLLILAVVAISDINNDGIIEKAQSAADRMHEESDKEQIILAVQEYNLSKYIDTTKTLEDVIKEQKWCSKAIYDETSKTTTVTIKDCGHQYKILDNGTIIKIGQVIEENKDTSITLAENLAAGTYILKYEDANGIMVDYADICSLTKTDSGESVVYEGFIEENCAPLGATTIGVYNSSNQRVSQIALGELGLYNLGQKQYSFAAISDTHIGSDTAAGDLINALAYFDSSNIEFTTICGDLATSGSATNLSEYKSIVDASSQTVYAISGNHEANNANLGPLAMDDLQPYTGQDLYYSFSYGNDVYIMMGMYDNLEGYEFAEGELQWLYETLEANRNKRCFLFMHLFPSDGSGDAVDLDTEGEMLNNTQGEVFYSLLSHYSNVIYFHGHSHQEFAMQEVNKMNNYDNIFGCHSIHIPSLAYTKCISGSTLVSDYDASEGYIVDVYENNIILKGRDFVSGKFLPIASYSLDTTIKNVEANTYYDPTSTIVNLNSNIFKSGSTWYESNKNKDTITSISFIDSYTATNYDESWDASISGNNQIMVYRIGTELTIVGNKNGVVANAISDEMFSGFTNLTQINGLEKLNTSKILSLEGMFKNCSKLTSLNLSGFSGVKPKTVDAVFFGCSSLISIDISNFDLTNVDTYPNLFYGCSSLQEVKLPSDMASNKNGNIMCSYMFGECSSLTEVNFDAFSGKAINLGGTFIGCTSLKNVKFGQNKILSLNSTFKDCTNLETIDISGFDVSSVNNMARTFKDCKSLKTITLPEVFDTSKVTTMQEMFAGCQVLTLDCSSWDTTSLTIVSNFNLNSSGVTAPVID